MDMTVLQNIHRHFTDEKAARRGRLCKGNMDSALQKKTQFENDNDMDKLLAPNECRIHLMSSMR